jgi:hypothetical protein
VYFKEFLRVRKALLAYTIALVLIATFVVTIVIASPPDSSSDSKVITVHTTHGNVTTKTTLDEIPWVALLFGIALFPAAIMATVLGSGLAQENDHLEVAWTRPRSRTAYATTVMAVDAAGIVLAQLIGFAIVIAAISLFGKSVRIVSAPDDALNALRCVLFPLAWYAIIVALSASLRGQRAGIIQGLIWPVALGLTVLGFAPLPEIWHRIVAGINFINPITYIAYHDSGSNVQIMSGSGLTNVTLAVSMLALLVVASWFAATFQWRRLQA